MRPPTFVGPLTAQEKQHLMGGLRSHDTITLRRSQILLASVRGHRASQIAPVLGCAVASIHNAFRAFRVEGLACLQAKSSAP